MVPMVLLKDIAFWTVVVVLQLASGYQVAKISLLVDDGWGNKYFRDITDSSLLRILFFPEKAVEKLNGFETEPCHLFFGRWDKLYILLHMFFWEIRIAFNFIDIILMFVIEPPIILAIAIIDRIIKSVLSLFKTALSA